MELSVCYDNGVVLDADKGITLNYDNKIALLTELFTIVE